MDYRYGSHTVFHHEANKGANGSEAVRGVPADPEKVLGEAFLGERVFLCNGWANDRRDD